MKIVCEMGAKRKILYTKPLNTKPLISIAELCKPLDSAQKLLQDCSLMTMIRDNELSQFLGDQNQSLQRRQPPPVLYQRQTRQSLYQPTNGVKYCHMTVSVVTKSNDVIRYGSEIGF
jgi:hypothetical protein